MKKCRMLPLLITLAVLTACGTSVSESAAPQSAKPDVVSKPQEPAQSERRDSISRPEIGSDVLIDPPYDFNPNEMLPRDFGDYFLADYPTRVDSYLLAGGTDVENEVTVLKGEQEGPIVYLVAGIHGDEIAGWMTGNLVKKINIKAGALHILSPANRWGAGADPRTRYITQQQDLNRSFPGNSEGTMAERAADSIYQDIKQVQPVFLFDLHEARANAENRDFLGSSLIYTSLDKMDDLYLDMLLATETGELCSERFNFFGPGPIGSINNTVTTDLGIPTITVETYRGYELKRRIGDQLDLVEYVLTYYGML